VSSISVSASIDISLATQISRMKILQQLVELGWSYDDNGRVTYLPIGDNDDFNWQSECISVERLLEILSEKDTRGELIGVVLTWENSNIGGHFLLRRNGTITISLNINRRVINTVSSSKLTDITWYITRIVPVFDQVLESISYEEHR